MKKMQAILLGIVLLFSLVFISAEEYTLSVGRKVIYYSNWGIQIESIFKTSTGEEVSFIIFDKNGNEVLGGPFKVTKNQPVYSYGPLTIEFVEVGGEESETDSPYVKRYEQTILNITHNDEVANSYYYKGNVVYEEGESEFFVGDSFEINGVVGNIIEISYALAGDTEPEITIQDDNARVYTLHEGESDLMVYGSVTNPESKNLKVEVISINKEESSAILNLTAIDEVISPIEYPEEIPSEEITYFCRGCEVDDKCYPYGFRKKGQYCNSESEEFVSQEPVDSVCENSFECKSNLCIDGSCISSSLWRRIFCFFSRKC